MVIQYDAVVDPGAVVVKPSHTGVAGGTVLGMQGATNLGGGGGGGKISHDLMQYHMHDLPDM